MLHAGDKVAPLSIGHLLVPELTLQGDMVAHMRVIPLPRSHSEPWGRAGTNSGLPPLLQLEKEEQIHSVDIGNDGSAFVEVLVGSSAGGAGEQDYEVSRDLRWAPG